MPLAQSARIAPKRPVKPTYPPDHKPAMQVPKGGSSCASCEYVSKDHLNCSNKHFIKWFGSSKLPKPADEYCSDWYEPAKGALS